MPQLEGSWSYDATAKKIVLDLSQTQPGDSYRLPLEFSMNGNTFIQVEMSNKSQRFEIPVESTPKSLVLDPNISTLMKAAFGPR